jgi:hypothetical protein
MARKSALGTLRWRAAELILPLCRARASITASPSRCLHSREAQARTCSFSPQPPHTLLEFIVTKLTGDNDAAPKRGLHSRAMLYLSARPVDTEWTTAIKPLDALRRCNQMALLGANSLRSINQSARPNTLAASRTVVEKSKPLRPSTTPWAPKPRPKAAVGETPHLDADQVLDLVVTEADPRRLRVPLDVAARDQRRHP